MCLWRCLWKQWAFDSVDWVKRSLSPMWVDITQSSGGLNGTEGWRKGEFTPFLSWDIYFLLPLATRASGSWPSHSGTYSRCPLVLRPSDMGQSIPPVSSSPACRWHIVRHLHECMSQFLITHLLIYIYIYLYMSICILCICVCTLVVLFPWGTPTYTIITEKNIGEIAKRIDFKHFHHKKKKNFTMPGDGYVH